MSERTALTYNIEYANYNRHQEQQLGFALNAIDKWKKDYRLNKVEITVHFERYQDSRNLRENKTLELNSTDGIDLNECLQKITELVGSHREALNKEMNELIQDYVDSLKPAVVQEAI